MEDKIEIYGPIHGNLIGHIVWKRNSSVYGEPGYYYSDAGVNDLSENILLYIAGLIKSANAARRRQNQK